jgi:hypothetical protein
MQTIKKAMERVGRVAERVGITTLADAAGLPESTVRSYRDRGWTAESLAMCEKLIAAAERLDPERPPRARARG